MTEIEKEKNTFHLNLMIIIYHYYMRIICVFILTNNYKKSTLVSWHYFDKMHEGILHFFRTYFIKLFFFKIFLFDIRHKKNLIDIMQKFRILWLKIKECRVDLFK